MKSGNEIADFKSGMRKSKTGPFENFASILGTLRIDLKNLKRIDEKKLTKIS